MSSGAGHGRGKREHASVLVQVEPSTAPVAFVARCLETGGTETHLAGVLPRMLAHGLDIRVLGFARVGAQNGLFQSTASVVDQEALTKRLSRVTQHKQVLLGGDWQYAVKSAGWPNRSTGMTTFGSRRCQLQQASALDQG